MFALTFLGTSASVPSAERNHPGLLVEAGSDRILVDCGEGTQRQLLRAGAGLRRLDRILLTHGHLQRAEGMTVYGSPGTLDVVVRMLAGLWGEGRAPIRLELAPLTEGPVSTPASSRSTAFRSGIATPTVSRSRLQAEFAAIFGRGASIASECPTAPCGRSWPKENR
jgi:Metallo-beta-lactamase superfamily